MRFAALLLGVVICCVPTALAQTVTIEGGAAGLGAAASSGRVTVSTGVGGGYVAASVNLPAATWLSVYGGANGFEDLGAAGQAGAAFRLGPEHWLARPTLRGGGFFASDGGMATGGIGVHIGRRAGGLFTADWAYRDGVTFAIVHMGAYFSFGGGD